MIRISKKLQDDVEELSVKELSTRLINNYKPSRVKPYGGKGLTYYEYIYETPELYIKPYFDFDKKIKECDIDDIEDIQEDIYDKIINSLSYIFNITENEMSLSQDNRPIDNDKEGNIFKISYHCIIHKKVLYTDFIKLITKLSRYIKKEYDLEIDESPYHTGKQKLRTVMSKKSSDDKYSLLRPINYNKDIKHHFVLYTDNYPELDINCLNDLLLSCLSDEEIKHINYENQHSIQDIILQYNTDTPIEKYGAIIHPIKSKNCPFIGREHKSNHIYLLQYENTLLLKCQDDECNGKSRVLYKNINEDTIEFDRDVFNSFDIPQNEKDNYTKKRDYFEKYYLYLRDINQLYRIQNIYNKQFDYYEREVIPVEKGGLTDLKYQYTEEDKIKNGIFIKRYMEDNKRKEIFNIQFIPDNKNIGKYYNLFQGFNYENVLNIDDEITEEDKNEFEWYKNYLKKYVCDNDDKTYQFFISHFASIIQNPSFLNHIIMLFYSSKQRTGKSLFTKFLSRVIGMSYCYFGSFRQIFDSPHTKAHLGTFINIIEEIDFNKSSKMENELKDYSQRENGVYNPKGKSEMKVNTYVRYIGTSNNSNALKITDEDQRIVVLEFNKMDNKEEVMRLERFYENKKNIYLFGEYLRDYKIPFVKRSQWINNRPLTNAYKQMVFNDSIKSFFLELYNFNDYFIDEDYISNYYYSNMKDNILKIPIKKLYEDYIQYCNQCNNKPYKYDNFKKNILMRYKSINKKKNGTTMFYINLKSLKDDLKITQEFINNIREHIENYDEDE